jgi:mRNA deadenylase 3'-5' endonuclease subunit Ccr4
MKRIIDFLKKGKTNNEQEYPFNKITNFDHFESIDVNSIKMGFNNVDKTIDFISKLTCEPPFSSYVSGSIRKSDYIMYEGNMKVIRTYNVPDLNIITQDIGPMPNEFFPSDHISYIADFMFE